MPSPKHIETEGSQLVVLGLNVCTISVMEGEVGPVKLV